MSLAIAILKDAGVIVGVGVVETIGFPATTGSAQRKIILRPSVAAVSALQGEPSYISISEIPPILRKKYDIEIEVQAHPNSTLGTNVSALEAVQSGFVDITIPIHGERAIRMQKIIRGFAEIDEGQVHYRTVPRQAGATGKLLLMFPTSPLSSLSLVRLIERIGRTRPIIAFDTLGQGDSCAPAISDPDIDYFADAAYRAYHASGLSEEDFDLFGTHTGARLALEIGLHHPGKTTRLILDGMGVSDGFYETYAQSVDLSGLIDQDGTQFLRAWQKTRDGHIFWPPYERNTENLRGRGLPSAEILHDEAFQVFQCIRAGHLAYRAAMSFPARERLPMITIPTLITCARDDTPYRFHHMVSELVPHAEVTEHPADSPMGTANEGELDLLCSMLTNWLDK